MNIDPDNLPAEVWAINRQRVRAGKGPLRIVPAGPSALSSNGVPCGVETKGGVYYPADWLFATLAEAMSVGVAIAQAEYRHEVAKHSELLAKLQAAFDACGGAS